jgi:uncharacterized repeat protein (TIGR03803 family)
VRDAAGNLYGTTCSGGDPGGGTVYKVDITGKQTVLYGLGGKDGACPYASLMRDTVGNLYGATFAPGVVFRLDENGKFTVLHTFTGGTGGERPTYIRLVRDAAGNLYGTTSRGGIYLDDCRPRGGCGVVFKLDKSGQETVLYSFTGKADGAGPEAGLLRDAAGNLYGTTSSGGATGGNCGTTGCGVVFKLDTNGQETVLHTFTGGADGAGPHSSLVRDAEGNFYGTAEGGGDYGCGVVFKLTP